MKCLIHRIFYNFRLLFTMGKKIYAEFYILYIHLYLLVCAQFNNRWPPYCTIVVKRMLSRNTGPRSKGSKCKYRNLWQCLSIICENANVYSFSYFWYVFLLIRTHNKHTRHWYIMIINFFAALFYISSVFVWDIWRQQEENLII